MKILNFVGIVIGFIPVICTAAELEKDYPQIGVKEIQAVFEPEYQSHSWYADFLKPYEVPKEIRSAMSVFPFYASSVVPELHFIWLRYFAALDFDNPDKRQLAREKYQHALEVLEKNKDEGCLELWKNAWEDGNPEAYSKLQELFKEHKHWCQVLSHFPISESEMMIQIKKARETLDFFYGSEDGYEKLNLETPHVSIAFARFEEAKFVKTLEKKEGRVENSIRHLLQGVHVHRRHQWTQEKIGETFGISQASVSNFLRGKPCPKLVQNVQKYYEDNHDFYFFEPRKKSGWSFSLISFLPWKANDVKKSISEEKAPLIKGSHAKKTE